MTPAVVHLFKLLALGAAAVATGQLLAAAVGFRRLRRFDATAAAGSALLGVLAWTVAFSFLSGIARLSAPRALIVLAVGHAVLLVVAWRRSPAGSLRVRGPLVDWLLLGGAVLVTALLALSPVLLYESFRAGNDTHTYCALGEWLQRYGFGETVDGPSRTPAEGVAAGYQQRGFPLGVTYLLALARAAGLGRSTLILFPVVSALGMISTICSLWWMTRRSMRLSRPVVAAALAVFALAPHAAYWAHHSGFLSQTWAVSGLLFGLSALAAPRGIQDRVGLVSFSLAAAFLCVVYVPFAVFLGAAALARFLGDLARSGREAGARRVLGAWFGAFVLSLVLVGLDVDSIIASAFGLLRSNTVGGHILLEPAGFAAIALGPGPGPFAGLPLRTEPGAVPLALAAAVLAAIGVRTLWRERRGWGTLAVFVALSGLIVKYGLFAQDPWTGERGQSWFVFKTVQYAFPIALLLQAAGLGHLSRRHPGVAAMTVVAAVSVAPAHLPWSEKLGRGMSGIVNGERPLAHLDDLLRGFRNLPDGELVLLGLPRRVSAFRAPYAALFTDPRPLAVDLKGRASWPVRQRVGEPGVVPLLAEAPPFDTQDRTDLGGGFALLTSVDRPRLVQVVARLRPVAEPDGGAVVMPLGRTRTKLLILAPRPGSIEVGLQVEPSAGAETSVVHCRVVPGGAGDAGYRRAVRRAPVRRLDMVRGSVTRVRLEAERGLNAVVLTSEGPPQRLKDVFIRELPPPGGGEG